jgi:hypothetical protein
MEVKMEPGQQLHIVNQLYPYTVHFMEDLSGEPPPAKRPREPPSVEAADSKGASNVKVAKQANHTPSSGRESATSNNVSWLGSLAEVLELSALVSYFFVSTWTGSSIHKLVLCFHRMLDDD